MPADASGDYVGGVIALLKMAVPSQYSTNLAAADATRWTAADFDAAMTAYTSGNASLGTPFFDISSIQTLTITESFDVSVNLTDLRASYATFASGISGEYTYYLGAYNAAISSYIDLLTTNASTAGAALTVAQQLNFKLSTILAIYSYLINKLNTSVSSDTAYATLNASIEANKVALAGQRIGVLKSTLDTHKEMVEYTAVKNRYMRNQLIAYGLLAGGVVGFIATVFRN